MTFSEKLNEAHQNRRLSMRDGWKYIQQRPDCWVKSEERCPDPVDAGYWILAAWDVLFKSKP